MEIKERGCKKMNEDIIKQIAHELKDASIKYLAKNLRTCGVCKIALDIPKTGNYHFKCMKEAQE